MNEAEGEIADLEKNPSARIHSPDEADTVGDSAQNLGPTWGQNQGLLGPNLGFTGGKGNRLNRTFGRGGGDRTHDLRLKRPLLYH
jgi:hypothetical protein